MSDATSSTGRPIGGAAVFGAETVSSLARRQLHAGQLAWVGEGIMLGVVSMRLVHQRIEHTYGVVAGWTVVLISIGLCSIGVVIGRFQRWNSWDLVTRPDAVMAATFEWVRLRSHTSSRLGWR